MNFEAKTTYTATDINGNEVVLSAIAASEIAQEYDRECYREALFMKLEEYCENEGLDANKISKDTIEDLVREYEDNLDGDDVWLDYADKAIEVYADSIRKDCEQQKVKQERDYGDRS